jgi:tRNA threonylcarbamoyladenosine biosynthesis protein TsaE
MIWQTVSTSSGDTEKIGELLGSLLKPPAVIELRSDLGGGKTTFVRGIAKGMGSKDTVSSPTFTLNQIYKAKKATISHHDFYRLDDAGILKKQLAESLEDKKSITVIEWGTLVGDILPKKRLVIEFKPAAANTDERQITFRFNQDHADLIESLRTEWTKLKP